MKTRLRFIIETKTDGRQSEFAALMGWSPQYLSRLLLGDSGIGLRPVVALLEKFPDIDARWLLLGEGFPFSVNLDAAKRHLLRLLSLEKYMPVMSPTYLKLITENGFTNFPPEIIAQWEEALQKRKDLIDSAMKRSTTDR